MTENTAKLLAESANKLSEQADVQNKSTLLKSSFFITGKRETFRILFQL